MRPLSHVPFARAHASSFDLQRRVAAQHAERRRRARFALVWLVLVVGITVAFTLWAVTAG